MYKINRYSLLDRPVNLFPSKILRDYLLEHLECRDILQGCNIHIYTEELIIECPDYLSVCGLSYHTNEITKVIQKITTLSRIIIMLKGDECDIIPLQPATYKSMITSKSRIIANYPELLDLVRYSLFPTYVSVLPPAWEWEKPIRCVLTSDRVREYSTRCPLDFHGTDLSLLYDKKDMEQQINILMREFDRNNCNPTKISDVTYFTYLSDPERKSIQKDPIRRYEYNADFEIQYIDGIGLLRICHCKDRRPAFR